MYANNPAHCFASALAQGETDSPRHAAQQHTTQEIVKLLREDFPRLQGSDRQLGKLVDSVRRLVGESTPSGQ